MKKNINKWWLGISLFCILFSLSSCLSGLDELESYHDTEIKNLRFEHRWERSVSEADPTNKQLGIVTLNTTVKIEGNVITCNIEVPEAGNPSMFTEEIRESVSLNRVVGMATISTAATIKPLEGAPVLGKWGDFSKECKYLVTAADGKTTQEWIIRCTLTK